MKIVCCKNCGAKYQLDDNDDITTFECSSCAGDLEYTNEESNDETNSFSEYIDTTTYEDSYIVQCEDCGLKYKIKNGDSILDYECDSCGGSLRYLDEDMNKELDDYLKEKRKEVRTNGKETANESPQKDSATTLKSITGKLEHFFSEERLIQIADDEKKQKELEEQNGKTARTTIPKAVLSKFGKEFAVPKSDDYNVMKNFIKDEFYKGIIKYYPNTSNSSNESRNLMDKIIKEPDNGEHIAKIPDEESEDFNINDIDTNQTIVIIGTIIFVLSIVDLLVMNSGFGIIALIIGVVIITYGLYKKKDVEETAEKTRIIREHLLRLPEEYYLFYNVKTPTSSSSINHLVVGPTGIYALLSKKYNQQVKLDSDNDNVNFLSSSDLDDDKIEEIPTNGNSRKFRYTTKQAKFSQDNKIKQKSLTLGEDLINFLNENNIKNCFVEPLVGFINEEVVVINMPLTDEDLFIEELINKIQTGTDKLDSETIDKCAVLISKYSADCSSEI